MSKLFLVNEALDLDEFQDFKNGVSELIIIEKINGHVFNKHSSVYDIKNYSKLFDVCSPDDQEIIKFIEQLTTIDDYICDENKANGYCGSVNNAFLGVDFSGLQLPENKKIIDQNTYGSWVFEFSDNLEKLQITLGNCILSKNFIKNFLNLSTPVQTSVVEDFIKAKDRGLATPFFPDTKIVANVTNSAFKAKVMELRVYSPVAVRVYFREEADVVKVADICLKSNANQNQDIENSYKILNNL